MEKLRGLFLFSTLIALTAATFFCGGAFPHACCNSLRGFEYLETRNPFVTAQKEKAADQDIVVERFRINSEDGVLIIPVILQGKRYKFVLDTGASEGFYDTSFRSICGDPIKIVKMQRPGLPDKLVPMYKSPESYVGKIALPKGSDCFCMDIEGIREASGLEINGILGMDFLKNHILRIDFDKKEVIFLQKVGTDPGLKVPLVFRGNWPHVMVKFQGVSGGSRFLVDTGCVGFSSGNLQAEAFGKFAKRGIIKIEDEGSSETITGTVKERFGYVNTMSLGEFRHKQLLFAESNRNVLGLGYWSRYVVTFDFPNSVMYLKKGRQFDRPERRDMSGLSICRKKGLTVVVSVSNDSPSAQAGVKPLDVLLKIDDVKSSGLSLWRIRRMFCQKDKKYRLLIRRGEKELALTMQLLD